MTQNIDGKVVAITGASSGLGAETARHLVREGAKVALGARRLDRLEALVQELGEDSATAFQVDVTDREQVKAFVDRAAATFGKIDVMINNAGLMPLSPLEMERFDEWNQAIDVNIKGVLWGIAAALPHFKAQRSGQFINVSSLAGTRSAPAAGAMEACRGAFQPEAVTPAGHRRSIARENERKDADESTGTSLHGAIGIDDGFLRAGRRKCCRPICRQCRANHDRTDERRERRPSEHR
jgi:NAD(P)-dependent dehydrogenase (short-subunit alcohol dehydrogenase family)